MLFSSVCLLLLQYTRANPAAIPYAFPLADPLPIAIAQSGAQSAESTLATALGNAKIVIRNDRQKIIPAVYFPIQNGNKNDKTLSFSISYNDIINAAPGVAAGDTFTIGLVDQNTWKVLDLLSSTAIFYVDNRMLNNGKFVIAKMNGNNLKNKYGINGYFAFSNSISSTNLKAAMFFISSSDSSNVGLTGAQLDPVICDPYTDSNCLVNNLVAYLPHPSFSVKNYSNDDPMQFYLASITLRKMGDYSYHKFIDTSSPPIGGFLFNLYWEMFTKKQTYQFVSDFSKHLRGTPVKPVYPNDMWTNHVWVMSMNWPNTKTVISDDEVKSFLIDQIRNRLLKVHSWKLGLFPVDLLSRSEAEIIIPIHLGPGLQVNAPEFGGQTCSDICAYHSSVDLTTSGLSSSLLGGHQKLYYSIIPYVDESRCGRCNNVNKVPEQSLKVMAYHELTETMVEAAMLDNYIPGLTEIGDPCSWSSSTTTSSNGEGNPVSFQRVWSFQSKKCVEIQW